MKRAKISILFSNTASRWPILIVAVTGTRSGDLTAMCKVLLRENLYDGEFDRRWVNWHEYLREEHPEKPQSFGSFIDIVKQEYARYTTRRPRVGRLSGTRRRRAREVARAGSALSIHFWRSAAARNLEFGVVCGLRFADGSCVRATRSYESSDASRSRIGRSLGSG
jgi:hypothetical protein